MGRRLRLRDGRPHPRGTLPRRRASRRSQAQRQRETNSREKGSWTSARPAWNFLKRKRVSPISGELYRTRVESLQRRYSIDDNASREFAHTLQQLTNLPLTEPGLNIPEDGGLFSLLEPDLQKVLELCCMYLVSLDEEFTPDEQNWVDDKFGLGTSERFINEMSGINWKICFSEIHERLRALTPRDQIYAKTQARHLFQKLMEADELKEIEQERLDHLMGFIREAFYQDE